MLLAGLVLAAVILLVLYINWCHSRPTDDYDPDNPNERWG